MSKIENEEFAVDLQLKSIELINTSISLPPTPDVPLNNFNFNINIESKADAISKLVFVIASIQIKSEDQVYTLGSITVSCIYSFSNFDEVIKTEPDGARSLPKQLTEILTSISISITRGVMFSTFKGTFLHNAFLPIVDPRSFQSVEN